MLCETSCRRSIVQCENSSDWMLPQIVVQCENSSDPMTLKTVQCELSIRVSQVLMLHNQHSHIILLSLFLTLKGLVHPKWKAVIIYSPLCCFKTIRLWFIFKTHIEIFYNKKWGASSEVLVNWLRSIKCRRSIKSIKALYKESIWFE